MSGHSHAKTVRRTKELSAQKRGQIFSKMARLISIAVKEGGPNPEANSKLRVAIETARFANMPKENIERAIKKGAGELEGEKLEEVSFEAFGPEGIAIIIEGITDNKNRAFGEIKQILTKYNGKIAGEGSVKWLFDKKGVIYINTKNQIPNTKNDELELMTIEAGAEDIKWEDDILNIYTKPENLDATRKELEAKEIKIENSAIEWAAKEELAVDQKTKEQLEKLFEELDESEAVQEIYSNLKE